MHPQRSHIGEHVATILAAALISATVSYVEVAQPSLQQMASFVSLDQFKPKVAQPEVVVAKHVAKPTPTPAATAPAPVVATPAPAPTPAAPVVPKATTNSFAHLRAGKGTNTAVIANVDAGTELELRDDSDATWQGITYQGKAGYIFKAYLNY